MSVGKWVCVGISPINLEKVENRLVLLYTYECDLGDGWEDAVVNNDPLEVREKALKMGANIIHYIFNN